VAKTWLLRVPWDGVEAINEQLCLAKNALHKPTSDGYEPTKELWESNYANPMELDEAVQLCRRCHKLAPFCFLTAIRLPPSFDPPWDPHRDLVPVTVTSLEMWSATSSLERQLKKRSYSSKSC
jgi:hypothetical protein